MVFSALSAEKQKQYEGQIQALYLKADCLLDIGDEWKERCSAAATMLSTSLEELTEKAKAEVSVIAGPEDGKRS